MADVLPTLEPEFWEQYQKNIIDQQAAHHAAVEETVKQAEEWFAAEKEWNETR